MKQQILTVVTLSLLAACGGSSSSMTEEMERDTGGSGDIPTTLPDIEPQPLPTGTVRFPANTAIPEGSVYSVVEDQSGENHLVVFDLDGEGTNPPERAVPLIAEVDGGQFSIGFSNGPGRYMYTGLAETESGSISILLTENLSLSTGQFVVSVTRPVDTFAPVSGTASMTGDYVGYFINDLLLTRSGDGVTGIANIEVDFGAEIVSGSITDRQLINMETGLEIEGTTTTDVILSDGTYDGNGEISGNASSALVANEIESPSIDGGLSAAIVGESADAVVGSVALRYFFDGEFVNELGVLSVSE